ncbi:VOC family protein [Streptosporangium sp. NPDC049644]|uniref:VOC family protein n=1 Tax=Streptosporangium sp. NPDC049644 TaxID=3155507 RepID=UPI003443CFFF
MAVRDAGVRGAGGDGHGGPGKRPGERPGRPRPDRRHRAADRRGPSRHPGRPDDHRSSGDRPRRRAGLFLHTDDFARDHERMLAAGVTFEETPRHEPYGTVAAFRDLYGNRWDLVQPRVSPAYG